MKSIESTISFHMLLCVQPKGLITLDKPEDRLHTRLPFHWLHVFYAFFPLTFLLRCSDSYPVKKKMVQGATAEDLKKKFQGLGRSFQANDADELDYKEFVKELMAGKK